MGGWAYGSDEFSAGAEFSAVVPVCSYEVLNTSLLVLVSSFFWGVGSLCEPAASARGRRGLSVFSLAGEWVGMRGNDK